MFNIRGWEWVIILIVVLLIFGPSKLPGLARSIGKSISEFRNGIRSAQDEIQKMAEEDLKASKAEKKSTSEAPKQEETEEIDPLDKLDEGPQLKA